MVIIIIALIGVILAHFYPLLYPVKRKILGKFERLRRPREEWTPLTPEQIGSTGENGCIRDHTPEELARYKRSMRIVYDQQAYDEHVARKEELQKERKARVK